VQLLGDADDGVEDVTTKLNITTSESVGSKTKKSRNSSAGGSANPFADAGISGSNFGPFCRGMGRMGGILDMLITMGGGMSRGM
jgi:hypothetical protein